jgi:hypothetical protein
VRASRSCRLPALRRCALPVRKALFVVAFRPLSRRLTRARRSFQPAEYYVFDVDSLDQNGAINKAGKLLGKLKPTDNAPKKDALQARLFPGAGCAARCARAGRRPLAARDLAPAACTPSPPAAAVNAGSCLLFCCQP